MYMGGGRLLDSEKFLILSVVGGGHHFLEFMGGGGSLNFVMLKGVGQDILFSY
jgi:hypothetical protein